MALELYVNTYVETLEDAGDFFAERLGSSAWDNATATDKEKALIMGFRALERIHCWQGVPTCLTQLANWPRSYVPKPGSMVNEEVVINANYGFEIPVYLPSDTVPDFILHAQCLEALSLLSLEGYGTSTTPASNPRASLQAQGVKSVSIDGVSESYTGDGTKSYGGTAGFTSSDAWQMVRPYLVLYGQLNSQAPMVAL